MAQRIRKAAHPRRGRLSRRDSLRGARLMRSRQNALWWGIPLLLVFLAMQAVPFGYSVWYSLLNNSFERKFVGLSNYRTMLENPYFRMAMRNTFTFTVPAVVTVVSVALLLAAAFQALPHTGERLRMAFILPMMLPSAAVVLVFQMLFKGQWAEALFGEDVAKTVSVFFVYVWKNTGLLFLILFSAMRMIDPEIYEAAALDGAGRARQTLQITLPSISGAILFSATYAVMQAFRVYKEAFLLYGAYPGDSLYMLQHYMNNHFTKMNFQNVAAAGTLFTLICLVLTVVGIDAEGRASR